MLETQRIKKLIVPFIKGLPIIIVSLLTMLLIAKKIIQYSVPKYQSIAKIKLDTNKYGLSANNLYEDFDVFSTEHKIVTEAELLRSSLLVKRAIQELDLGVSVSRIGRIKSSTLYKENPLVFVYEPNTFFEYDKTYRLSVTSESSYDLMDPEGKNIILSSQFGKEINLNGSRLTIKLNGELLQKKRLHIVGQYSFEVRSLNKWVKTIREGLDVKAVDKEIPVIRVVMKSESPILSADVANKLCKIYVEDYIATKSYTARKTLEFVDSRMEEIKKLLTKSEDDLEIYRLNNKVVNTRQETETGIRAYSKLKLQAIQLDINEKAIIDIEKYITKGDYYDETAVLFGFGDLTLVEMLKKLKLWADEKRDLQIKFKDNHQKIINVQNKIDDVKKYIKEAILQNKNNIIIKRTEIEKQLSIMSTQFDKIPTRDREMRMLEREFQINESVYTFLAEKKLDAQIASQALISFHRVIDKATIEKKPVSPNKTLITFVLGLLGIFIGIFIVYSQKHIKGTIQEKTDIEKHTATPIIGVIKKAYTQNEIDTNFTPLATSINLKTNQQNQTLLVTSSVKKEGKSYVCENLKSTYLSMGYSVAYIDISSHHTNTIYDEKLKNLLDNNIELKKQNLISIGIQANETETTKLLSHKNIDAVITKIQEEYDILIIDTPGSIISINALTLLKYCTKCLYVVCANKSKVEYLSNIDIIQEDYNFKDLDIVFNKAPMLSSYSGNFYGSQLSYEEVPKGFKAKLKHYYKYYS